MTKRIKLSELVLDYTLYPRPSVDSANVTSLVAALEAGVELPACTVDEKSKRVADGFNRVTAYRRLFGDDYMVACRLVKYATEAELFLDAIRLNAAHGKRLNTHDLARSTAIARRLGASDDQISASMGVTAKRFEKLIEARFTGARGDERPERVIKRTVGQLADTGKKLTKGQIEIMPKIGGMSQLFYVNQIHLLIDAGMLDTANERLMERLAELGDKISGMSKAVAA